MSSMRTQGFRRAGADHFEPEDSSDPQAQRRLRGHLEQIDYTAFASNREVLAAMLGPTDARRFQKLAVACAQARANWIAEALRQADNPARIGATEAQRLAALRSAYEELAEAYEAMRRAVERGYLSYRAAD